MREFKKKDILKALQELDAVADQTFELIVAGGSAMVCSYQFPLGTLDVDAIVRKAKLSEVDVYIKKTAKKLNLAPDWLNMWVSSFTHYLPKDYETRLKPLLNGKKMTAKSLGKEDLLVLKCFAHRAKDVSHVKSLIKQNADIEFVEDYIEGLIQKNLPLSQKALDFLYDILSELEL